MTISIVHPFHSAKSDGPDPTLVQPSNWNAAHTLTQASGYFLGRVTAGAGATEEVSPASAQTLLGLQSAAYVTASSLATNVQIAAATDTAFADADFLTALQTAGGALIKRSWANLKTALASLFMSLAGNQTITGGFKLAPYNMGTITAGFTVDATLGNYQFGTINAAIAISPPANDSAVTYLFTNGASAGAITFPGFTVNANTGEPLTTVNGSKFLVNILRLNGVSTYWTKALQA